VEPVLPERAPSALPPVVILREVAFQLLHHPADVILDPTRRQEVGVVAGDTVGEQRDPVLLERQPKPLPLHPSGPCRPSTGTADHGNGGSRGRCNQAGYSGWTGASSRPPAYKSAAP
jgi:hypothetical protein